MIASALALARGGRLLYLHGLDLRSEFGALLPLETTLRELAYGQRLSIRARDRELIPTWA